MACKITYKDGKIDKVYAPNGSESRLYKDILALPEVKGDKDIALNLYAQTYTPQFKQWFGDWELLAQIKDRAARNLKQEDESKLSSGATSIHNIVREAFLADPEKGAFEIAVQANTNTDDLEQVEMTYGASLVSLAQELFPNVGINSVYTPTVSKVIDENGEPMLLYTYENTPSEILADNKVLLRGRLIAEHAGAFVMPVFVNELSEAPTSPLKIDYFLQSQRILQSKKAEEVFKKGLKNNWDLNKILLELQIPEQERKLLITFNTNSREELLTNIAANYSYTIEVDTRMTNVVKHRVTVDKNDKYLVYTADDKEVVVGTFDTLEEANSYLAELTSKNEVVYSNDHYELTVPGGTDYRENEIATPEIIPSITGHAGFSSPNGIGWFRSDTKANEISKFPEDDMEDSGLLTPSTTRRILELQSDLFQKSREKVSLVADPTYTVEPSNYEGLERWYINRSEIVDGYSRSGRISTFFNTREEAVAELKNYLNTDEAKEGIKKSAFLQLLLKDNNWITFFVKSIIQDSARKGFEKVTFPTGETIAKIEGHEDLETFIRQHKQAIEYSKEQLARAGEGVSFPHISRIFEMKDGKFYEAGEEITSDRFYQMRRSAINSITNSIKEFERELEEAQTNGLPTQPIFNLYETTIFNILKKQGYNPTRITDEYGNGWYSVDIEPAVISAKPDSIKSVYNRGSYLSSKNDVTLEYVNPDDPLMPNFHVYHKGEDVGVIMTVNDGMYLTIDATEIDKQGVNIGTYAYLKLAKWAQDNGMQLRSDRISDRMSPAAKALWNRFLNSGQAIIANDHYIFEGNPESVKNNIYFSADPQLRSSKAGTLTLENVKKFLKVIGMSVDSIQSATTIIHNGKPVNVYAMADLISKSIQIAEGKEDVTLPEEAMHFMVALIKVNRPKLYENLINRVRDFNIYKQLINSPFYTQSPEYRTETGALDIQKIKEEAVAKILAEYLIDELEGQTEKPENLAQVANWWKMILDWIRDLFGKYTDPFQQVIDDLRVENFEAYGDLSDIVQGSIFYSAPEAVEEDLATRNDRFLSNKTLFNSIKNRTKDLNITKVDNKYYKNGVEGKKRVSDLVEDYYADLFRNKVIPEEMKPFYEQTRQDGTYIHEIMEDMMHRLVDSETGLLRDEPLAASPALTNNPVARFAYDYIGKNLLDRVLSYPQGTRFMYEQIIYDPVRDIYGTVDFIAIEPNGRLNILDWKTLYYEEYNRSTGVKEFKQEAFNIQIKEYKRILNAAYNVENFGQLRAIPIKKIYVQDKDKQGVLTGTRSLVKIQIGSANPKEITDETLRPVIIKEESTGNRKLDNFVNILERVAQDIKSRKVKEKFDSGLYDLINNAIYELRIENDIKNLYTYSSIELSNIKKILADINKNKENYTNENVNEALTQLNYYNDLLESLEKASFLVREDIISDETSGKLNKLIGAYERARDQINDLRKELTNKVAKTYGIFNLLKPEKVMSFWNRYMRTMSQSQSSSVQLLYKMISKVYNRIELEDSDETKKLTDMKRRVDEWAKNNNASSKEALAKLLKYNKNGEWTGDMISMIDSEFYKQRTEILKSGDKAKILKWWDENYDLAAYAKWYEQEFARYKQEVENSTYSTENEQENEATKKFLIERFEKRFNIAKHPQTALAPHNRQAWSKNIKIDKWYSDAYKFLVKPENRALLDAYNLFNSINKELVDLGIIEAFREHTFIPSVRKDFADTMGFQGTTLFNIPFKAARTFKNDFVDSIKVNDQELLYSGYINPLTGEKENKLFAAYTAELGEWVADPNAENKVKLSYSKKSADLFTVYSLMNKQKLRYKYMRDVEDIAQALRHVEATKGSIETSRFGRVQRDRQGNIKVSEDNTKNAEVLDKHIRASIYGEIIQNDADSYVEVSWNKFAQAWNRSPFGKIKKMKEIDKEKPTRISATKLLMKLNNFNQIRVLGLNLATAVSNLFGGTASTYLINKQLFDNGDLTDAARQMVSGSWAATEEMQKRAALVDYFLPLIDNRKNYASKQLSVAKAVRVLSEEWLMAPQRKSDEIVQLNIFLATIANTTVKDGQLVNIRQEVQSKYGWGNRFNLSTKERQDLEKKIEKEIDEMKKNQSLIKIAKFEKTKEGGKEVTIVTIPGIDRKSQTVEELRETIQNMTKNVLGSSSEFDLAAYKYNVFARLFMTFKNWIPRQLDVRFGEFRYDAGHDAYEWGRARMFYRAFGARWMQSFAKMVPYLGRAVARMEDKTYLIDRAKAIYQEKVNVFKELGLYDESQFITEDAFIQSFLQGVDAEFTEFRTITVMMFILISALMKPDEDDDDETKNMKKKLLRQVDKLSDELSFFYSPQSFIDIMGSKPMPVIGFIGDTYKLIQQTGKQWFGYAFNIENGKWEDEAKPMKYLFKAFPVTKELLGYMPIFDPEMAKEMGIKLQAQNRN